MYAAGDDNTEDRHRIMMRFKGPYRLVKYDDINYISRITYSAPGFVCRIQFCKKKNCVLIEKYYEKKKCRG